MTDDRSTFAARHSMDSPEWYTPSCFVESARLVMGGIDLDPASHEEANARVRALRYFDKDDNGLIRPWHGRVFLNPPGGKGLVNAFWRKALGEWLDGRVQQLIWIGYSLEQLQTLQQAGAVDTPLSFPTCFTSKRIAFVENAAKKAERQAKEIAAGKKPSEKNRPTHSNYISYIGPNIDAFVAEFSQYGKVKL